LWPPVALAGRPLPSPELRDSLEASLREEGVNLVPRETLEAFLREHRVRYTGGVHGDLARAAAEELGVEGILLASIDLYVEGKLPAMAATLRYVSPDAEPQVRWMETAALAGDEAPGLFERGLLTDLRPVREQVFNRLADSLARHLRRVAAKPHCAPERRFRPEAVFVGPSFKSRGPLSVAVLPFVDETDRRGAGELMAYEFVRALAQDARFHVIDPGATREELLRYRVVVEGGIALDTARVVLELARADLVVTGVVRKYRDSAGGTPEVEFTAYALDRANNELAFQVSSSAQGRDGVFFFDAGQVNTARELSCRMVATAMEALDRERPRSRER
jgi:hypothetical protein